MTKKSPIREFVKSTLSRTGYTITRPNVAKHPQHINHVTSQQFFDLYFAHINPKDFFFVQIGANDGTSEDMIHQYVLKYQLAGILVEPQKNVFEKLKQSYRTQPNLVFANVAIAATSGSKPFYEVKKSLINESNFYQTTSIASLDKETLRGRIVKRVPRIFEHISDNLDDYIEESLVEALSFDDFTEKYGVKKMNFLFIDCEGYDYEIIKTVNIDTYSPDIIYYESIHLSDADRAECEAMLHAKGYQTFRTTNDTCAFK